MKNRKSCKSPFSSKGWEENCRGLRFPELGQHQLLQLREVFVEAAEGDAETVGCLVVAMSWETTKETTGFHMFQHVF